MPLASLCTSLVFLKIPACLYNSTMHSDAFFYFFTKARVSKDRAEGGGRRAEGGGRRAEGARVFFYLIFYFHFQPTGKIYPKRGAKKKSTGIEAMTSKTPDRCSSTELRELIY